MGQIRKGAQKIKEELYRSHDAVNFLLLLLLPLRLLFFAITPLTNRVSNLKHLADPAVILNQCDKGSGHLLR